MISRQELAKIVRDTVHNSGIVKMHEEFDLGITTACITGDEWFNPHVKQFQNFGKVADPPYILIVRPYGVDGAEIANEHELAVVSFRTYLNPDARIFMIGTSGDVIQITHRELGKIASQSIYDTTMEVWNPEELNMAINGLLARPYYYAVMYLEGGER